MNEITTSQEEKTRCVMKQVMQIGSSSSPNDVRALYSEEEAALRPKVIAVGGRRASYAGSESIKIIPNEQSLIEQQLCENEARAFDREYAMYQRIQCGRHVFVEHNNHTNTSTGCSFPYLTNCPRDVTSNRYVSNAIDNGHHVPKTVYASTEKDTLMDILQFDTFTGLPDPTYVSYNIPTACDVVDDDGVFDLDM